MKRLICSLDGTWNDDDGGAPLTNVAKLHRAILAVDKSGVCQFVRYVVGIATNEGESFSFLRGALGLEVGDRIKAGYQFLCESYEPGDEIFLFGFSRGAYEARSLASFVTLFGIARKDRDFSIEEAWALYRHAEHERDFDALARLSSTCHYPVRIRCIGVWDTVGNIGIPFSPTAWLSRQLAFHDTRLHDTTDVALHALSIDEERGTFRPTLFVLPEDTMLTPRQHVEQVWFAGTHADVGGGWPEAGLSDITLLWMAERVAATTGLAIDIDTLKRSTEPDPLGLQHYSATGRVFFFSRLVPFLRLIQQKRDGVPESRRRYLGYWRTGKLAAGLRSLNETIHESALARLGQSVREASDNAARNIFYRPQNLVAVAGIEVPVAETPPAETPVIESAARNAPVRPEPANRKRPGDIEIRILAKAKGTAVSAGEPNPAGDTTRSLAEARSSESGEAPVAKNSVVEHDAPSTPVATSASSFRGGS